MNRTLSILLRNAGLYVHKDVIPLITRYFHKIDSIFLILAIYPNSTIITGMKQLLFCRAAEYGYLGIMKYMLANNFPYDEWVFINAVNNGNLDNLQWLLDNNFPYVKKDLLNWTNDSVVENWIDKNL